MGYAWTLGLRYLRSKKRAFISVGTLFAIIGVALGVAALATVMSVTGGFQKQFRDKVLGVNAHVLVLKRTPDFSDYRTVMDTVSQVPGVIGVAPFVINPMLVTAGEKTATGVLMKGVDPQRVAQVLDLPQHLVAPKDAQGHVDAKAVIGALRTPGAKPPAAVHSTYPPSTTMLSTSSSSPFQVLPSIASSASGAASGPAPIEPPPVGTVGSLAPPTGDDPYVKQMEGDLAKLHAENAALAAKEAASSQPAPTAIAPSAPTGDIEPAAGYGSKLPTDADEDDAVKEIIKKDELLVKTEDLPGVIIGSTLAKNLNVGVGDRIRITSPAIGFASSAHSPIAKQFRVIGLFEAGFDQYDSKLVYVDLYEAQSFYDQGDSVTGVEMRVNDIDHARDIRDAVAHALGDSSFFHVMDWEELNHPLFTALKIQQIGMSAVLALIIVVAAFTVIATLIMIVLDKRKEIAVLKAMGARDAAILRAFLYQGLIIGAIGTALGLLLGYATCRGLLIYGFPLDPKVYFISRLPVEVRASEFLVTGAMAIVICLCATIIPALHAASIRPADGLRAQ